MGVYFDAEGLPVGERDIQRNAEPTRGDGRLVPPNHVLLGG